MSVGKVCVREVHLAERGETAISAAEKMWKRNVGTLLILNEEKYPIGILTDRDLVTRVLARGMDGRRVTVGPIMTVNPRVVTEDTPIEEALGIMRAGGFRRLPVVNSSRQLVGVVTMDDILDLIGEELVSVRGLLRTQGRPGGNVA